MSRITPALGALTLLILFFGSTLVFAAPQVRPPLPPGLKGKDIEKLRKRINNNNNNNRNNRSRQEYERKKKEEEDRYHVAQIGLKFEVVQKKNWGSLKKSAPKKYKAQLGKYNKSRAEAEKKGEKFKGLKPPKTVFKILTKKGFKTQKEAKSYADRLQRQVDSKRKR